MAATVSNTNIAEVETEVENLSGVSFDFQKKFLSLPI